MNPYFSESINLKELIHKELAELFERVEGKL